MPCRLYDLIKAMEGRYPVGSPTWYKFAVTGEPYVEIIKVRETEHDVLTEMFKEFESIASALPEGKYTLYWRTRPILEASLSDDGHLQFRCFMRFLISAKEPDPERVKMAPLAKPAPQKPPKEQDPGTLTETIKRRPK